jgi:hypothetical protein
MKQKIFLVLQDENSVIIIETERSYRSNFLLIVIEIFIHKWF